MKYPSALQSGRLIRRYQRFLADIELDGGARITAHCANTGRMTGCAEPGFRVRVSPADFPHRKLKWTLEQVHDGTTWISVHPALSNKLVLEAVEQARIPELEGYRSVRSEQRYGTNSRVDLLLSGHRHRPGDCFVEVKSTTLAAGGVAAFPDAVTERGRRHLQALADEVERGNRGVVVFCVQRADCHRLRPADEIDPAYGAALREAVRTGVEALAYAVRPSLECIEVTHAIPVELP